MNASQPSVIAANRVVADDLRFKARLGIGENAYTSLRVVNRARELWDVLGAAGSGAAVAKSSLVASTFFAPSGLLGALGLGTAVTPVGWVALAAVASGGACYGMYCLLGKGRNGLVIEIPRYLNTPLDQLGMAIFDLIAPLALRLAAVDGRIDPAELQQLKDYLCLDWGLDEVFVEQALSEISPQACTASLEEMARQRAELLHANPDCDHATIARDLSRNLRDMLEAKGPLTAAEGMALLQVEQALRATPPGALARSWDQACGQVQEAKASLSVAATALADQTMRITARITQNAAEAAAEASQRLSPAADQLRGVADEMRARTLETANTIAQEARRLGAHAHRAAVEAAQQLPDLEQVTDSTRQMRTRLLGALQSVIRRDGGEGS